MSSTKPTRISPAIPNVGTDPISHSNVLRAIKECIEIHERSTGNPLDSFMRLRELVDLGILVVNGTQIARAPIPEYADDAAAANGGIPVGGEYHIAGAVHVRVA